MTGDTVDLLFGALSFTPFWGVVDCLLIFHFFFSWYRSAKKTGWKIDFWYLTLFTGIFQSTLMLYPFSASFANTINTLGQIDRIAPFVDRAFAISIVGYCSIWLGRYCFDGTRAGLLFAALAQWMEPLSCAIERNIKNRATVRLVTLLVMILGISVVMIQFKNGHYVNGREFFLKSPWLRPFFNVTISVFPIGMSFLVLRYVQFKEKSAFFLFCILLAISFFFGTRFILVNGLLFLFFQQAFHDQGKVSLIRMGMFCIFLFFCAIMLGNVRNGIYDPLSAVHSLVFSFFYGNNFSDLRDFAWILSYWDEEYLYGSSFVSALISFIPRAFSDLREEWSFSMYTNGLIGFDSEIMPGLRTGFFGEPFLNFGWVGVILFGGLFGFALRFADHKLKEAVRVSGDIIRGYSHTLVCYFVQCFAVSASMWMFYVFVVVNLVMIPFTAVMTKKRKVFSRD